MDGQRSPVTDIRELLRRPHLGEPDRRIDRDLGVAAGGDPAVQWVWGCSSWVPVCSTAGKPIGALRGTAAGVLAAAASSRGSPRSGR
jgi:hypothetical protein